VRFIFSVVLILLCNSVGAGSFPDSLRILLAKHMRFGKGELTAVERGQLVMKFLDTTTNKELAFAGIVHVKAPASLLIQDFRNIETFRKGAAVLKVKKISDPPTENDFKELTLPENDLKALKKCKPGKCDVKLSRKMLEEFRSKGATKANEMYREMLLDYVQDYLAGGNSKLIEYLDEKKPVRVVDEFQNLLGSSPYLKITQPELFTFLQAYKKSSLQHAENFLYWSKERIAFRDVITTTHVTIYSPDASKSVFASKQIYASHYFNASLALTFLFSDPDGRGFYLMYVNRSRTDMLGGIFSSVKRSMAKNKSSAALKENLALVKQRLEAQYRSK
jgi:hypothetical protein